MKRTYHVKFLDDDDNAIITVVATRRKHFTLWQTETSIQRYRGRDMQWVLQEEHGFLRDKEGPGDLWAEWWGPHHRREGARGAISRRKTRHAVRDLSHALDAESESKP